MYKIALSMEVPHPHQHELQHLIDMHFVIASEIKKNPQYGWFYERDVQRDKLIILDNGMYEEGHPMSMEELIDIGLRIKADVVIAPDQHPDKDKTLALAEEFIIEAQKKNFKFKIGLVPQGDDMMDLVECYHKMTKMPNNGGPICLSFLNDRPRFLESMQGKLVWRWHHMLGLYNLEEISSWPPIAWSMDTVKPLKAAYHDYFLESCPRKLGKWNSSWEIPNKALMYRNIARLHKELTRGGIQE